jgi:hypothetical protein
MFVSGEINLVILAKQRIIRTGQNLQINCTIFSSKIEPNLELKWKKAGKPLEIKSQILITNSTLQLQLNNVEISDGGEYRCVVMRGARVINSTSVHVMVGGEYTMVSFDNIACTHHN